MPHRGKLLISAALSKVEEASRRDERVVQHVEVPADLI